MDNTKENKRDLFDNKAVQTDKQEIFKWEGKPSFGQTLPLALQHVVAMIAGCITPALVISGAAGLTEPDRVILIQMSLIVSGVSTLLMLFAPFGKLGARLPVIMGASFAYVPTMSAVAALYSGTLNDPKQAVAVILGAQLVGGVAAILLGLTIKVIKRFFPSIVTGTVVFVIGLSLYPIALRYMGGAGSVTAEVAMANGQMIPWGAWQFWLVGIITLATAFILNNFTKGITKLSSVLFAMVVGYVISIPFGMVDFAKVASADWLKVASPLHFGLRFEPAVIISFIILFIVNSIQAIGDLTSTTVGGMDREPTTEELQGGIIGYGFMNIMGAVLGAPPTATFSQNVGIVATNKVIARRVFTTAAVVIIIAGLFPKLSAILTTIPYPVIGGATLSVFSMITMNGLKLIAKQPMTFRNLTIVGMSVAIGMGFTAVCTEAWNAGMHFIPQELYTAIGTSPVVLATLVAILLNLLLKETPADRNTEN
ncbi:uracil-xanthine permease family protein [Candidatus Enterococcus leclercqii]|uniref:uracil-xanthine permease family protein n=1 Tax=Candidatus Enterococcus leclercqii TaxID=1857218 RepID=UPI0013795C59|nr:solute carrier family 23 protein [Enterococcus sp. CU9D]KAF1290256.1 uracil permease [Enterococcus sp. CU9D]